MYLIFLSASQISAQEYFFNYFDGWRNNYSIELENEYLMMGLKSTSPSSIFIHELYYNTISFEGELLDTLFFSFSDAESTYNGWGPSTISKLDDENYIVSINKAYDLSVFHIEGSIYNFNLETKEFTFIQETNNELNTQYYCIEVPNDSTILVGERVGRTNLIEGLLDKAVLTDYDVTGVERWQLEINEECQYCSLTPVQILSLSNGNIVFMYSFWTEENLPFFHEREKAVIVIVNGETGELIGEPISPGDEENYQIWVGGMVEMENGDILVSYTDPYYYDEEGEWHFNQTGTVHVDQYSQNGTLQFVQSYINDIPNSVSVDSPGRFLYKVTQMQELDNGNMLISGTTGYGGMLLKINQEGDVLWHREYFPHAFEDNESWVIWETNIYHVLLTSDGGFLCAGEYLNNPGQLYPQGIQTAFALKVDQYGCLEEGCQVGIFEQVKNKELRVYPNPSKGEFRITLTDNTEGEIVVFNMLGEMVFKESEIKGNEYLLDFTSQEKGIYLISLLTKYGVSYSSKIIKQ